MIRNIVFTESLVRACLVSCQEQTDKGKGNHLEGIMDKPLTIFPKSAAFVKPAESACMCKEFLGKG